MNLFAIQILQQCIPLDIFKKITDNKSTITNELEAWLTFLSSTNPQRIQAVIQQYPEFIKVYQSAFTLRRDIKEVFSMFSDALRILDRNEEARYYSELEMKVPKLETELKEQKTLNEEQKTQLLKKDKLLEEQKALNEEQKALNEKQKAHLLEIEKENAQLKGMLVSGKPVSSTAYAFFVIIQVVKYFISWACGYYLAVIQTMAGIHQK